MKILNKKRPKPKKRLESHIEISIKLFSSQTTNLFENEN